MTTPLPNPRVREAECDAVFVDRWSPRAFSAEPLDDQQISALFEAARWAPSCMNEQPWLFVFARTQEDRARFTAVLSERNQLWASHAPLLLFVLARRSFARNGKENRFSEFDAGAAWMSLALQARRMGLYTHAMAGYNQDMAYDVLGAQRGEYEILAAVAVGRRAEPAALPVDMASNEAPGGRRPLSEVFSEGVVSH